MRALRTETDRGSVGVDLVEPGAVGGFFALRTGAPDAGQQPLARIYSGATAPLTVRVDTVAARLGAPSAEPPPRSHTSIAHLGLAARLWSVALGSAALTGQLFDHPDLAGTVRGPRAATAQLLPLLPLPGRRAVRRLCFRPTAPAPVVVVRTAVFPGRLI